MNKSCEEVLKEILEAYTQGNSIGQSALLDLHAFIEAQANQIKEYQQFVKTLSGSIEIIKTERDEFETNCRSMVSTIHYLRSEIEYMTDGLDDEDDD